MRKYPKNRLIFQIIVKSITILLHFQFVVDSPIFLVYNHIKLKNRLFVLCCYLEAQAFEYIKFEKN